MLPLDALRWAPGEPHRVPGVMVTENSVCTAAGSLSLLHKGLQLITAWCVQPHDTLPCIRCPQPLSGLLLSAHRAGPFAAAPAATKPTPEPSLPETLYMDAGGLVHYGLSQSAHDAVLRTLRALQDAEAASTQTAKLNMALAAMVRRAAVCVYAVCKGGGG